MKYVIVTPSLTQAMCSYYVLTTWNEDSWMAVIIVRGGDGGIVCIKEDVSGTVA